jgi:hypothetical protein
VTSAGLSAAAAPDLSSGGTVQSGTIDYAWTTGSEEQWVKMRLPGGGPYPYDFFIEHYFFADPGAGITIDYDFLHSADPGDGTSLTSFTTGGVAGGGGDSRVELPLIPHAGWIWAFFKLTLAAGTPPVSGSISWHADAQAAITEGGKTTVTVSPEVVVPIARANMGTSVRVMIQGGSIEARPNTVEMGTSARQNSLPWNKNVFLGNLASPNATVDGSGSSATAGTSGGSFIAIPQTVAMGTRAYQRALLAATPNILEAPDLTGTVRGTAPWRNMHRSPNEGGFPTSPDGAQWHVWHKFQLTASVRVDLKDDPGQSGDTTMALWSGPPDATPYDISFITWDDDSAGNSKARIIADLTPGWYYVEHQYYGDTGSSPSDPEFMIFDLDSHFSAFAHGFTDITVRAVVVGDFPVGAHYHGGTHAEATFTPPFPNPVSTGPIHYEGGTGASSGWSGTIHLPVVTIQDPIVTSPGVVLQPDLGNNDTIDMAITFHGSLVSTPPDNAADILGEALAIRAEPGLVLTLPTPAIVEGLPTLPRFWCVSTSSSHATQGPTHIHSIPDPDPVWNPATSGWFYPPPAATGAGQDGRWTVQTLPDPAGFPGEYYWLGEPSSADGTRDITNGARLWAPDKSTPYAPAWQSFFPFKPSVRALDSFLPGGNVVHHPKGVHFNSRFIEHMWLDWGGDRKQPFTFIMAGMIASFPDPNFVHYLLDAGRNPDAVGFPRISDSQTGTDRRIADGLQYRSMISAQPSLLKMTTDTVNVPSRTPAVRFDSNIRPKMFFGVFNGGSSYVGAYDVGGKRISKQSVVANGSGQHHRFFVMGRQQGWISQNHSSHIMMFEIRYWRRALTSADLDEQYAQLSSTYKFSEYRAV